MEPTPSPALQQPGILARLARGLQWGVFAFFAIVALVFADELKKAGTPGAPLFLLYAMVISSAVVAVIHLPALFFRSPKPLRWAAYLAFFGLVFLSAEYRAKMDPVWERTPEGAREAAERRRQEAIQAEAERQEAEEQARRHQAADALANLESAQRQLQDIEARLEACFTTFGHRLPALEGPVRESLHNPDAFEHVRTVLIVPDEHRNNVEMTFRAENGFGAIRTARVRAQLIPGTCTVQNVGDPAVG